MDRVVVTGIGVVTPVGIGCRAFWESMLAERCGFSEVSSFDTSQFKVKLGAEVGDFKASESFIVGDVNSMGRASQFAITAAHEALAGIDLTAASDVAPHRVGVCVGTTSGEPNEIERLDDCFIDGQTNDIDTQFPFKYPCHSIATNLGRQFSFSGPNQVIPTACAAGNYAIAHAMDLLRSGQSDVVVAGGADAFSRITYAGFYRLGAIAPEVVRPFDKNRQGMIPGEGAGMLVLESESHARKRGAEIYAEVAGYGLTCDAFNMTAPSPDGEGAARAMKLAMQAARVNGEEVGYVCAHGTGTRANDFAETRAVHRAFGASATSVPVSSIKSMLGHTMGAASAIEAVACVMSLRNGVIPPTANFETRDPDCDLDYVTQGCREKSLEIVMNNANAFGGNNASVVLKEYR